ncbi:MAG TPA: hypothetical protein VIQ54_06870 [Polyangia bacterium]|jgi:hypothetical protein
MGLTFQVGAADQVLEEPLASKLAHLLGELYPGSGSEHSESELWYSTELGWSGWEALQTRVKAVLGPKAAPHFDSMEAWFGAYLPTTQALEPGAVEVDGGSTPLSVASLPALVQELQRFGAAAGLPTDAPGLEALAAKYDDDELCDDDMDVQTYAQLLQGALVASERRQPLWIIK